RGWHWNMRRSQPAISGIATPQLMLLVCIMVRSDPLSLPLRVSPPSFGAPTRRACSSRSTSAVREDRGVGCGGSQYATAMPPDAAAGARHLTTDLSTVATTAARCGLTGQSRRQSVLACIQSQPSRHKRGRRCSSETTMVGVEDRPTAAPPPSASPTSLITCTWRAPTAAAAAVMTGAVKPKNADWGDRVGLSESKPVTLSNVSPLTESTNPVSSGKPGDVPQIEVVLR
ncbi:hypothetical protein Vafri_21184, partial [Volvox africanus]